MEDSMTSHDSDVIDAHVHRETAGAWRREHGGRCRRRRGQEDAQRFQAFEVHVAEAFTDPQVRDDCERGGARQPQPGIWVRERQPGRTVHLRSERGEQVSVRHDSVRARGWTDRLLRDQPLRDLRDGVRLERAAVQGPRLLAVVDPRDCSSCDQPSCTRRCKQRKGRTVALVRVALLAGSLVLEAVRCVGLPRAIVRLLVVLGNELEEGRGEQGSRTAAGDARARATGRRTEVLCWYTPPR